MRVAQLAIACRTEWRREDEELAERLIADTDLEPREEWRAHLYRAARRLLQGARQSAREAFAQMRHSAAALNAPSLPGLHEPELVARVAKALREDLQVDLWQLTETARDLASGVTLTDQQLRDSASQWRGELLPDCYDEWVELPRESARRNYLEVVDELASRAHRRGDLDEELRWLEKGHFVAPYDETRPIRAVRLLTTAGRIGVT
jgi:DNA-binding SARP family transcriptional activator